MFDERHPTLVPGRQRLSVLVGLLLLSLALEQSIDLPTRSIALNVFGTPLGLELSGEWLMAVMIGALACTGTDALVRTHPRAREVSLRHTFVYWVLPGLLGLAAARLLSGLVSPLWIAGLVVTALLFVIVLVAEYTTVDPLAPVYPQARLVLNVVAYGLAFALFVIIYQTRGRSLITATAMMVVSFTLALDLLWSAQATRGAGHTTMIAAVVGLVLAECSWVMNYWQISGWSGGMLLLLIFYVLTGIAAQHLQGRLNRAILVEFAVVALAGIGVLLVFHP